MHLPFSAGYRPLREDHQGCRTLLSGNDRRPVVSAIRKTMRGSRFVAPRTQLKTSTIAAAHKQSMLSLNLLAYLLEGRDQSKDMEIDRCKILGETEGREKKRHNRREVFECGFQTLALHIHFPLGATMGKAKKKERKQKESGKWKNVDDDGRKAARATVEALGLEVRKVDAGGYLLPFTIRFLGQSLILEKRFPCFAFPLCLRRWELPLPGSAGPVGWGRRGA